MKKDDKLINSFKKTLFGKRLYKFTKVVLIIALIYLIIYSILFILGIYTNEKYKLIFGGALNIVMMISFFSYGICLGAYYQYKSTKEK